MNSNTEHSKRRTYNCMNNHHLNQEDNNKKRSSDLSHIMLLNDYLVSEQSIANSNDESFSPSLKKRKTASTSSKKRITIEEEQSGQENTTQSNSTSYQDFYDQMEKRMEVMCLRMNQTLKKQEEYLEKVVKKEESKPVELPVKQEIAKRQTDDQVWTTLCGMYTMYSIHHRKYQ